MLLKSFEMDARRAGVTEGIQQGIQRGITQGSYQNKLETAAVMKSMKYPIDDIHKITGLSEAEIEAL